MSVTRVGATKQYSDGWENIFGGSKGRTATKTKSTAAKNSAQKKSPKKGKRKAAKKPARRA
jgi:hypothetical protein